MSRRLVALALVALALVAAGCADDPHWSLPLAALDRVPLTATQPAPGQDDAWIAGGALGSPGDALLMHYAHGAWSALPTGTTATLWWLFALGTSEVYAVGERGTVLVWNGSS